MNVNGLVKQISSILTPQTDNFYRDISIYGHFFQNTNDIMWWGDVGMKFLTRAPFDVRWLREKRLDDPYGGFLYETTVEDKVLIMFEHKYNQEKYDQPGADFSSCTYEFFYSNHPFLRTGLWSGTMRLRYAYVVDLKNKSFKLASQWKTKVPSYDTKEKYERTELNEIYNTLQKELDGIADQVQAEYLEMQRKAARAAYVRACFDPVNGREDKEALGEYDRAEQEFVKSLYTLAEAVMKRKECTVIYDFLSESGTLTNSRISMLAFLAAIENENTFDSFLSKEIEKQLAYAAPFDGIILKFIGQNPKYMTAEDKAAYTASQNIFFNAALNWINKNEGKFLSLQGKPQNVVDKNILSKFLHLIIEMYQVTDKNKFTLAIQDCLETGVPTDRFIMAVSTPSLDTSDTSTGFIGTERAIIETAYWITADTQEYDKCGIAINNVQNDYYQTSGNYHNVKKTINIMNPAPTK